MARIIPETSPREQGQGIAEYAVMLGLVLILVLGTVRLVAGDAMHAFSRVTSALQHRSDAD